MKSSAPRSLIMPGLVPGIHVFASIIRKDVDGRDRPGQDESDSALRDDQLAFQRLADHPRQIGFAIGLGQQQHAGIEPAVMDDGILRIA